MRRIQSTVMTPFQFDRDIKLSSFRIGVDADAAEGIRRQAPRARAPIQSRSVHGRSLSGGGGGGGGEGAAAFDFYVQMKAKELGVDIATIVDARRARRRWWPRGRTWRRWWTRRRRHSRRSDTAGIAHEPSGRPLGAGARFHSGAASSAYSHGADGGVPQGLRHVHSVSKREAMSDCTRRPAIRARSCRTSSRRRRGRVNGAVMGPGVDSAGVAGGPGVVYNPKPICAVLAGNLFNDDKILSVAHHFQTHTDWHTRHPSL